MGSQFQYIKELLTHAGLKATQQRIVIFHALTHSSDHPTAEMIYEVVKEQNPSISLGTIYKTLDALVSAGLAERVASMEGNMRYDSNMNEHNHIYCSNTKEIIDFQDEELNQLLKSYFEKKEIKNFEIENFKVQISGKKQDPNDNIHI